MEMFVFNGFEYIETLPDAVINDLPDTLVLTKKPTSESILFRLLLGTLLIKESNSEESIPQKIYYAQLAESFEEHQIENPIKFMLSTDFGHGDLDWYFNRNRANNALYNELLTEFTLYFLQRYKENHTSAFLHLYRALEYMSYSFPMVYSSRTSNIYSSFDTFKGFFVSKQDGQLKFFRKFISVLFDKKFLNSTHVRIDTYAGDNILDKQKIEIIRKLCTGLDYRDDGYVISINIRHLLDFMITLRNRYFHFQYDRSDNISNMNFNSELFFEAMNDKFANWLTMIYIEILSHGVYKLNLMPHK